MRFFNLFKKELAGLINKSFVVSILVMIVVFYGMGTVMDSVMSDAIDSATNISIADVDDTDFTRGIISRLEETGYNVKKFDFSNDREILQNPPEMLKKADVKSILVIPQGFTESILTEATPATAMPISRIVGSGQLSNISATIAEEAVSSINGAVRSELLKNGGFSDEQIAFLDNAVINSPITVVDTKWENISLNTITGFMSMQGMLIPLTVFILVMFTSQMMITSVSTEKIDKTLETLLSSPISRLSLIFSKMLAAAVIAMISAGVYLVGFNFFMGGIASSASSSEIVTATGEFLKTSDVLKQLGLSISSSDYILIGAQIFVTLLIVLSVSMMLGALVTDAKSAQTMVMPIMFLVLIPYLVTMLVDLNTLPTVIRYLMYAIPFTHTMTSMSNIMFGNMTLFWIGLAYQIVVFIICIFFTLRLFTSDKILTVSLNFGQKRKFQKSTSADDE